MIRVGSVRFTRINNKKKLDVFHMRTKKFVIEEVYSIRTSVGDSVGDRVGLCALARID